MFYINGYSLDESQMKAIKSEYKATLVVAGAGSGKTLTILGLIKYLIEYKNYKEDEILVISFTNDTVKSLTNKLLDNNYTIDVKTFHKLGLYILDNKYSIISDNYLSYVIDEYFESYIKYSKKNRSILRKILYTNKDIDNIFKMNEYYMLKKTIYTFIKLAKSNNYNIYDLYRIYNKTYFNNKRLIKIIIEIYILYKRELESMNKIDFDDMISNAIDEVKYKKLKYKYIIIDEFQDTSLVRFNLIKEIIKYTNSNLFCVGDDYQSIYRFSGCDLNLFINFKKYFYNSNIYYLKNTYRNSNELIKVSTSFIMKNNKQLKKNISSNKNIDKPIVIVFNKSLEYIIKLIDHDDIMILGRNNSDISNINYSNKYTIHKSKGLESEYVILVNSDNIPNTMKNEHILKYVLNTKEYILHEEERRLFYVALTRTKNKIYIMVNKRISPFIKEIMNDYKNYIQIIK